MCGIFGIAIRKDHPISFDGWRRALASQFLLSETRGKEAAGIAIATQDEIWIHKDSVSASRMLATTDYRATVQKAATWFDPDGRGVLAAIGHSRLVTNGLQGIDANNQPVWRDDSVIVHNGIIVNVEALWAREAARGKGPRADVDTEVIGALMTRHRQGGPDVRGALTNVFADVVGETSVAMFLRDIDVLALATNTGSLYVCTAPGGTGLFFASERFICEQLQEGPQAIPGFAGGSITQIAAGRGATVALDSLEFESFPLAPAPAPAITHAIRRERRIEDKADRQLRALRSLRRCTRCVLPETMPFISFDAAGVCNFCHDYEPWVRKPLPELEGMFDHHRSRDGAPDCIMGFSGGRDSSYGLHLIKTKYGMTPLCFSYDWGMVTDLARRNQARMCGKLGVEHIWISADIKQKRANIRANVQAWMKNPDLGIIPLFMAGDKQFFWHANKMIEGARIPLLVWCTNRFEKTEFKTGFAGIPPEPKVSINRPSALRWSRKAQIALAYGSRFAVNPAYLNRSVPDTIFAAFSYYAIPQDHLFLFDYEPWDEDTINDVLVREYDWELATDTDASWRIGDGTAPFYNYIYYTVAGMTEADTFRSNQIREGVLTREKALALIEKENRPRWPSIREYCQLISVDFDEVIRTIDRIPKLY